MSQSSTLNAYAGKKVLITGGLGFMGLNLTQALCDANADVTVLNHLRFPSVEGARPMLAGATIVNGDVRDAGVIGEAVAGRDVVFHLAGRSGPVASNAEPLEDLDVNGGGTLTLLQACRQLVRSPKLVFPSSRLVYAPHLSIPVAESAPTKPVSVYGIHKLLGEHYLSLYQRLYGVRACVLRITNPYGPFQRPEQNAYGIVNWFIQEALHGRPLTIYGGGGQLRDYVHVSDVVQAMLLAGREPEADGKVFNVGSGHGVSFVEMAHVIVRIAGRGELRHIDWPSDAAEVETGDFVADTSLIAANLGWRATVPLESGIREVIARYAKKPASAGL